MGLVHHPTANTFKMLYDDGFVEEGIGIPDETIRVCELLHDGPLGSDGDSQSVDVFRHLQNSYLRTLQCEKNFKTLQQLLVFKTLQ